MKAPLKGCVVAITGAGRGIGAATATALARAGASVAIGDIDLTAAEKTAAEIGSNVLALRLDVTDQASFCTFLDTVEAELGPIHVMINNAGIMPLATLLDEDDAATARILAINVHAMIRGTREAVRRMTPHGTGHVINIASTAGKAGLPGGSTYCASKSAVITFSEAVRGELRDSGIEVSCVMPGIVQTELASGVADLIAFKSITPETVADAIVAAILKPRFDVYVPASAGGILKLTAILPRATTEWVGRRMGADRVFVDASHNPNRATYEARAKQ